jgi:hypothetical protein
VRCFGPTRPKPIEPWLIRWIRPKCADDGVNPRTTAKKRESRSVVGGLRRAWGGSNVDGVTRSTGRHPPFGPPADALRSYRRNSSITPADRAELVTAE